MLNTSYVKSLNTKNGLNEVGALLAMRDDCNDTVAKLSSFISDLSDAIIPDYDGEFYHVDISQGSGPTETERSLINKVIGEYLIAKGVPLTNHAYREAIVDIPIDSTYVRLKMKSNYNADFVDVDEIIGIWSYNGSVWRPLNCGKVTYTWIAGSNPKVWTGQNLVYTPKGDSYGVEELLNQLDASALLQNTLISLITSVLNGAISTGSQLSAFISTCVGSGSAELASLFQALSSFAKFSLKDFIAALSGVFRFAGETTADDSTNEITYADFSFNVVSFFRTVIVNELTNAISTVVQSVAGMIGGVWGVALSVLSTAVGAIVSISKQVVSDATEGTVNDDSPWTVLAAPVLQGYFNFQASEDDQWLDWDHHTILRFLTFEGTHIFQIPGLLVFAWTDSEQKCRWEAYIDYGWNYDYMIDRISNLIAPDVTWSDFLRNGDSLPTSIYLTSETAESLFLYMIAAPGYRTPITNEQFATYSDYAKRLQVSKAICVASFMTWLSYRSFNIPDVHASIVSDPNLDWRFTRFAGYTPASGWYWTWSDSAHAHWKLLKSWRHAPDVIAWSTLTWVKCPQWGTGSYAQPMTWSNISDVLKCAANSSWQGREFDVSLTTSLNTGVADAYADYHASPSMFPMGFDYRFWFPMLFLYCASTQPSQNYYEPSKFYNYGSVRNVLKYCYLNTFLNRDDLGMAPPTIDAEDLKRGAIGLAVATAAVAITATATTIIARRRLKQAATNSQQKVLATRTAMTSTDPSSPQWASAYKSYRSATFKYNLISTLSGTRGLATSGAVTPTWNIGTAIAGSSQAAALSSISNGVSEKAGDIISQVTSVGGQITGIQGEVNQVKSAVTDTATDISDLTQKVNNITDALSTLTLAVRDIRAIIAPSST